MNYSEACAYIVERYKTKGKLGLDGMERILARMGAPHKDLRVIHVAGTNGKGSNCAYLHSVLKEAGYKVGMFTSPHLRRFNERFIINGVEISDDDFAFYIKKISEVIKDEKASFFEIFTLMALDYFKQERVDFAIIEVGIGGRLDSTNIVNPVLCSITAPGLDHQELLGDTPEALALEDAGIIKNNCPVVLYPTPQLNIFEKICEQKNAPLYCIGNWEYELSIYNKREDGSVFSVRTNNNFNYKNVEIGLSGMFQVNNAVHALLCIEALILEGFFISKEAVYKGMKNARWDGRFQIIKKTPQNPFIVLDGAHNESGALAFREALRDNFLYRNIVFVLGISKNKEYKKILEALFENFFEDFSSPITVICSESNFKAKPAFELCETVKEILFEQNKEFINVIAISDYEKAFSEAFKIATLNDGVLVITGSLYLVGDVSALINK